MMWNMEKHFLNRRVITITVGFMVALVLAVLTSLYGGYSISIDGKTVGTVKSTQAFASAMTAQKQSVAKNYGVQTVSIGNDVAIIPVWEKSCDTDATVIANTLNQNLDYEVSGVILMADNKPIGYYEDNEDAGTALTKAVLATASVTSSDKVVDCGFDNQLALSDVTFNVSKLNTTDDLAKTLAGSEKAAQAAQDTAAKSSASISETVKSLPTTKAAATDDSTVKATPTPDAQAASTLAVTTVKTTEITETVPYSQVTQQDANLFNGTQSVAQQGQDGSATRTALQVIKGNQVVQSTTLNYQVTQPPVNEVVAVGTKAANTVVSKDGSNYLLPCNGTISSFARGTGAHGDGTAVDIANAAGTPIYASASGTITRSADKNDGYGNCVELKADDGKVSFLYGHNSQLIAKQGDHVNQGDVIALMGSTGDSTGNHCHFEIQINGTRQHLQTYFDLAEGMTV